MDQTRIVIVDDDPRDCEAIVAALAPRGASIVTVRSGNEGLALVRSRSIDLLIASLDVPGGDGLDLIKEARRYQPDLPAVVITDHGSFESSLNALRLGVIDYLTKPLRVDQLTNAMSRAAQHAHHDHAPRVDIPPRAESTNFESVGASPAMREVIEQAKQVALAEAPVYLWGEPGVGKQTLARMIHAQSDRAAAPFVAVNCAAVRQEQLEAMLFGVESSFADGKPEPGMIERAQGGFLYLQNIEELPRWIQSRLCETFATRSFTRIGGADAIAVDIRVAASGNQELSVASARGTITTEMFYYLNVAPIYVPPLRHRKLDIKPLVERALRQCVPASANGDSSKVARGITHEALQTLTEYSWPGNIHELMNLIRRAALFSPAADITLDQVKKLVSNGVQAHSVVDTITVPMAGNLKLIERSIVNEVVNRCHGNKAAAARTLGLHRRTLYRIIQNRPDQDDKSAG